MLKRSNVRPLKVGAGSGGRTGELASAVELVENAGEAARCFGFVGSLPDPSSATAAGGGDEGNEDVVCMFARSGYVLVSLRSIDIPTMTHHNENSADELRVVHYCISVVFNRKLARCIAYLLLYSSC